MKSFRGSLIYFLQPPELKIRPERDPGGERETEYSQNLNYQTRMTGPGVERETEYSQNPNWKTRETGPGGERETENSQNPN